MIYFIQAADKTGPIKIGYAVNPVKRLGQVQRMSPTMLTMLATADGDREREARIHRHFSDFRLYGEWFTASEEVLEFIANPNQILPELIKHQPLSPRVKPKPTGLIIKNEFGLLWKNKEAEWGRNVSVVEVCEATGLNWETVNNMKTGKTNRFDSIPISKLCKYFEVPNGVLSFLVFRMAEE